MPRPSHITREEVFLACDQLLARGEKPGWRNVRHWLGHRGSAATISRYITDYRDHITHAQATAATIRANEQAQIKETIDYKNQIIAELEETLQDTKRTVTELRHVIAQQSQQSHALSRQVEEQALVHQQDMAAQEMAFDSERQELLERIADLKRQVEYHKRHEQYWLLKMGEERQKKEDCLKQSGMSLS